MSSVFVLGIVAGTLCTASFIPQVFQIWRSKSAKDLSLVTFIIFCAGVSLWIVYGFYINSLPVIIANFATLFFASLILIMKVKYK